MVEKVASDHIKFSPDILIRLGEELVPHVEQGILELVKNSYDALATECAVKLISQHGKVKDIVITDNGKGMSKDEIINGWLLLGHSGKSEERLLELNGLARKAVGDKGLGRLSALRQGSEVQLHTRPEKEPGKEYSVNINWSSFQNVTAIENVEIDILVEATQKPSGTDIHIKNVRVDLGRTEIERLARDLILLSDPFETDYGFKVKLVAKEYREYEQLVKESYFDDANFHLVATLRNGVASAQVLDFKGDILYEATHDDILGLKKNKKQITKDESLYRTTDTKLELWSFLLGTASYSARKSPLKDLRAWLNLVGGVHIYHRGVRVKPYGDQGNDWLEMNLRRSRSPEERPSTNNSLGYISVADPSEKLKNKTDRIGFVENEAFLELKKFTLDCLEWMARARLKDAEVRRKAQKKQRSEKVISTEKNLETVLTKVPPKARSDVQKAVNDFKKAVDKEVSSLRDDLQLYRSLATAGAITAKFSHQTKQPISNIIRLSRTLETKGKELLGENYESDIFCESVNLLKTTGQTLKNYSSIPLTLLRQEKRKQGVVFVNEAVQNSISILTPIISTANIKVKEYLSPKNICVKGSYALVEAIVTNFITNAVTALTEGPNVRVTDRLIGIETSFDNDTATIIVSDNGPGIVIDVEEMWLPGRTTTAGGTGFGLTIVKDCVDDLGGKVTALANGQNGGAEFLVELPGFVNQQGRLL